MLRGPWRPPLTLPRQPTVSTAKSLAEIAARHLLTPYMQGNLDNFCSLYGTINALRLAVADHRPLTKVECRHLFQLGVEFLHRKNGLHSALTDGMGTRRRLAVARHLAGHVSAMGVHVAVEQADYTGWSTIHDALRWVEASLVQGSPVLIALMGGLNHYTVVAGVTPATLQLFDSIGLRFIRKSSCRFRSGFHQIPPNGLLRITVVRTDERRTSTSTKKGTRHGLPR